MLLFAKALFDNKVRRASGICTYDEQGLEPRGASHFPFSLMNGLAGEICFLSDILKDMEMTKPDFIDFCNNLKKVT